MSDAKPFLITTPEVNAADAHWVKVEDAAFKSAVQEIRDAASRAEWDTLARHMSFMTPSQCETIFHGIQSDAASAARAKAVAETTTVRSSLDWLPALLIPLIVIVVAAGSIGAGFPAPLAVLAAFVATGLCGLFVDRTLLSVGAGGLAGLAAVVADTDIAMSGAALAVGIGFAVAGPLLRPLRQGVIVS